MINLICALNISIGIAANAHLEQESGFVDAEQQTGTIGLLIVDHKIIKDFSAVWIHASEINDGVQGTAEDRDYIGIIYTIKISK